MKAADRKQLGAWIKLWRTSINMTQRSAATALSVTPVYLCRVEQGKAEVSLEFLYRHSELFGWEFPWEAQ